MDKKNYFNFLAFRKALYDIELSMRARVVYMHLLQKSSSKGCDEIELTKPQIASDLGILTKGKTKLAPKNVQNALNELQERGYLTRWQKYKGDGVPLTIKLNFDEAFLRKKQQDMSTYCDKNGQDMSQKPSENFHPYNPSNLPNPSLSSFISPNPVNPSLSSLNEKKDLEKECEEPVGETVSVFDGLPF